MRLERLWIKDYKSLRDCDIEFRQVHLLNAIIGSNGSGKSNVLEAILHILIGVYFKKPPPFDFKLEYETRLRRVLLISEQRNLSVFVDGERKSLAYFAERLRDGEAQVYYPDLTLVYYSGECQRVSQLIAKYRKHFERLTRKPDSDRLRPLFLHSSNTQAKVILLALFAHGHQPLTERLSLRGVIEVSLVLRSPSGFDPEKHEPKLWNTVGAVRRIVSAIDETATSVASNRLAQKNIKNLDDTDFQEAPDYVEERTYHFSDQSPTSGRTGITALADRLAKSEDNLYLALEHLRARGIFLSVSYRLIGRHRDHSFEFDHLSEGEKQLLAVVGALHLTNRPDNLVLLDEPDTHLNPQWSWDFPSMLTEALDVGQQRQSSILMATHTPIMISGMTSDQVLLAQQPADGGPAFRRPRRHPRGQGIANLLCSSEFFGLPSSLDKETQKLLDERLAISVKLELTDWDRNRLKELNSHLEILSPGISERDPDYVAYLRQRHQTTQD